MALVEAPMEDVMEQMGDCLKANAKRLDRLASDASTTVPWNSEHSACSDESESDTDSPVSADALAGLLDYVPDADGDLPPTDNREHELEALISASLALLSISAPLVLLSGLSLILWYIPAEVVFGLAAFGACGALWIAYGPDFLPKELTGFLVLPGCEAPTERAGWPAREREHERASVRGPRRRSAPCS